MTWFDLSVPLRTGMPVYPGDPEVRIASALTVEADGANVLSLALGSHSGTHADAPLHVGDGWAALDELPLSRFGGIAEIVDVRGVARGGAITTAQLAGIAPAGSPGDPENPGDPAKILLLHTGCAAAWGTDEYLKHPWLEPAAAQLIVDRGYRAIGLDALSVDPSFAGAWDGTPAGGGFPAHAILAGNGCIIVENLTGLEQVQRARDAGADVEVFLFPLNIPGADGAPIRAVARPLPVPELRPTVLQQTKQQPTILQSTAPGALSREEVQEAADRLVAAFAATDTEAYFAAFSPQATFIFHPEAQSLGSRSAYRTLWDSWLASGWRVLDCRSSEQDIQLLGATAVFSHRVATTVQIDREGGRDTSDERETIIFSRALDGSIVCVHEHLSACPVDV
ncbi:cyclase family protein [Arthrobacter sp. ES3-54]|uniref:cyclase family protein n=1 Tax=Arthrobacter sp. ES3-54 TaxID=1502991 RepID=UPI0024064F94|nr:cyclase family protein [Arthrobacter sp. ES3-54]MDF9752065.1 kynurenine formamidase/ketosteroid isomerase-like protein [Arthrobacter sp. ES3-54]